MQDYDEAYFAHIAEGSARSASYVVPVVQSLIHVKSVADFGCGTGTWLAAWLNVGVEDVQGVDSPHLPLRSLVIPPERFVAADLVVPIRLGRRFDLAESLEVAEHLPIEAAATFIETLVAHAPVVLFSAAPSGQGGENHINEQPYAFWRELFSRHGYQLVDALRPRVAANRRIEPWYRHNALLFVDGSLIPTLPSSLRKHYLPESAAIKEYAPAIVRIRNRLLSRIPPSAVTRVAVAARRCHQLWHRVAR